MGISSLLPKGKSLVLTLHAYFDESGKFADQRVIAFGGVVGSGSNPDPFFEEWERCLVRNGLSVLTMKEALRHDRPLSERNPALGASARVEALLPFVRCIKNHLFAIVGVALDVGAFRSLPSHCHQLLGSDDPVFSAFLRTLMEVVEMARNDDKVMMICDDEEASALPMYTYYRRVRLIRPKAKEVLKSLCFGDDEYMYALQAADCVSSIIRREADKRFFGNPYDYEELFAEIDREPTQQQMLWWRSIAFADKAMLLKLAETMKKAKGSNG